jgi:hypothetical protein
MLLSQIISVGQRFLNVPNNKLISVDSQYLVTTKFQFI